MRKRNWNSSDFFHPKKVFGILEEKRYYPLNTNAVITSTEDHIHKSISGCFILSFDADEDLVYRQ